MNAINARRRTSRNCHVRRSRKSEVDKCDVVLESEDVLIMRRRTTSDAFPLLPDLQLPLTRDAACETVKDGNPFRIEAELDPVFIDAVDVVATEYRLA